MLHADLDTLAAVRVVLAQVAARGGDAAEELDRAGLLYFPARDVRIRAGALSRLADLLQDASAAQLASFMSVRVPQTVTDAQRLFVLWIRHVAKEPT